jgi:hypothetical protein
MISVILAPAWLESVENRKRRYRKEHCGATEKH